MSSKKKGKIAMFTPPRYKFNQNLARSQVQWANNKKSIENLQQIGQPDFNQEVEIQQQSHFKKRNGDSNEKRQMQVLNS